MKRRVVGWLAVAWLGGASDAAAQTGELIATRGDLIATRGDLIATRGDLIATGGDLIERTLAIVGTQVITLSDARAAIRFGLIAAPPPAEPSAVTQQLVDRELMLREVQRYAPPAPADSAVEAKMSEIRQRLSTANAWSRILEETGFTEVRLRAWVRDDFRTVAYLAQRFASASTPTESEIAAAFAQQRAEFERAGTTLAQASPILRDRLIASRRAELIADWVTDLRRRTEVVILPQ